MQRAGTADLLLHGGSVPPWLFGRMKQLALPMVEAMLENKGKADFLERLSNPFWFQSFGSVIGMDWNSSGMTTTVLNVLKQAINPVSRQLGLYVCGGKGKSSMRTPQELLEVGNRTGLDGHALARSSKLSAKVDNTALQDGFNLYIHSFIVSDTGKWTVVQQGMNPVSGMARRYHWHSGSLKSFVEEPHAAVCGQNQGKILNLVHGDALPTRKGILEIAEQQPDKILKEVSQGLLQPKARGLGPDLVDLSSKVASDGDFQPRFPGNPNGSSRQIFKGVPHLEVPTYHKVRAKDVDMKRLGSILWLAQENEIRNFEELLLLKGLGPRTLQSLTLVSEVIHGTPSRFSDPARFSFAHGGKDATPFPVPTIVYDETIATLRDAVDRAKIGGPDKLKAIAKLTKMSQKAEQGFTPNSNFDALVKKENDESYRYGGRSVFGFAKPKPSEQLSLFD